MRSSWFALVGQVSWVLSAACSGAGNDSRGHVGPDGGSGAAGNGGGGAAAGNGGTLGGGGHSAGGASGAGGVGSSCRADADCASGQSLYCAPAGASTGCGICPSPGLFPTCATDADCNPDGGSQICVGACGGACSEKSCVSGCSTDASCREGEHCSGVSHRCEATACATDADCPPNFGCTGSSCTRRSCQMDRECQGYCVTRSCYGQLGQCQQPRA